MKAKTRFFSLLAFATRLAGCKFQSITRSEPDGSGELRSQALQRQDPQRMTELESPPSDSP